MMQSRIGKRAATAIFAGVALLLVASPASASCAMVTSSQQASFAHQIFIAQALKGPTVGGTTGIPTVLLSPARFRVDHYLKGSGPAQVLVQTAFTKYPNGVVAGTEDLIMPQAGQWWVIYSVGTVKGVVQTSRCAGSSQISGPDVIILPATGTRTIWLSMAAVAIVLAGAVVRVLLRRVRTSR